MSHLLIIQGESDREARSVQRRCVEAIRRLCGVDPSDEEVSGSLRVVKFPRLVRGSTCIARDRESGGWAAGSGTWVLDERRPGDALATLAAARASGLAMRLPRIDGSFVLACGGGQGSEVLVATDPVGTLHAYRARVDGCLVLCTSSLVLAAVARPAWDVVGCAEFLATGTVFGDRTLFRGIRKLLPRTLYRVQEGCRLDCREYWSPAAASWDRASGVGSVEGLARELRTAMRRAARIFKRPAMDLTGGLDSRALLGAARAEGLALETVVNGAPNHPDVHTANALARRFDLDHLHQVPPADWPRQWWRQAKRSLALCDGEYDLLEYARILDNHERLARDFDASINGSGGELCKGYWWELLLPRVGARGRFDSHAVAAGRFATDPWSEKLTAVDWPGGSVGHFTEVIRDALRGLEADRNTACMDHVYLTLRMQRWHGRIASATNRVWPCLSPFLFRGPMEAALSAAPRTRLRNRMSRRLIEHLDPPLARAPLAQGYPALPLRPGTAHLFLPLAAELLGKMRRKVAGRLGVDRPEPAVRDPAWTALLEEPEVRAMLEPGTMRTRCLYRAPRLDALLDSVATVAPSHLGRILTLELLARSIDSSPQV